MTQLIRDHTIRIEPNRNRIRVTWRGHVVADTERALNLFETSYPAVRYIPREDVAMALLARSELETRCPYKGVASYYSFVTDDGSAENAIWTYDNPIAGAAPIKDYLAFDPKLVDGIDERPA